LYVLDFWSLGVVWRTFFVYCVVMFNILSRVALVGGNMRNTQVLKYSIFISLIVAASLASATYALSYSVRREVVYTETLTIKGQEQTARPFYLSAPAVLFEVQLHVSEGTIKWSPHSATLFEAYGEFQGWECETDNGIVKWRIDPETLDQIWYLSFFNEDTYEKEVTIEVTKVWSEQNYQTWT
jgi:hypothetical protein